MELEDLIIVTTSTHHGTRARLTIPPSHDPDDPPGTVHLDGREAEQLRDWLESFIAGEAPR